MRRGHRAPPRPPLPSRAVIAIPDGDVAAIEAFRARHDPLAAALRAHVTLVFPFASSLSPLQVATHVRRTLARWPAIPIRLQGAGAFHARWVHLRVTHGAASIVELHDRLYRRAFAPFLRSDLPYEPHVTIGRADDAPHAETLVAAARAAFPHPVDLVLRAATVVRLAPDGSATRECEVGLG